MRINHYLAALKQHLVERTKGTKAKHVELGSNRMQQDEDAVVRALAGLQAWVPNMWSPNQTLINIATGVIAPAEMTQNVSTTEERGEQASQNFISRITRTVTEGNETTGAGKQSLNTLIQLRSSQY